MTALEKMGLKVILGICLWIVGLYVLIRIFGESFFIPIVGIVGWFFLIAYTIKFHKAARRKDK